MKDSDNKLDVSNAAFKFGCGILLIPVAILFAFVAFMLFAAVFGK